MNLPVAAAPQSAAPPSSAWVRFLRSYGPTPNNLTLFDEFVTDNLVKAKVKPITLSSPQLEKIKERIDSGVPGSILIAGTAGDGKTYHCRGLWTHLGGAEKDWTVKTTVKHLKLADGRQATFVKDLSELNDEESDAALTVMERSMNGNDTQSFVVIAANHGQILERLRDLGKRQGRVHPLRKPIQDAFLQHGASPAGLAIFDLSRTTRRESLSEVLKAVAGHQEWENCKQCSLRSDSRVCPIYENRSRVLGELDNGLFSKRLGDIVEVSRLNGWHLPVRDLLALASNMILGHGDAKFAKEGLMACSDVAKIQEKGAIEEASLYGNVFGSNLPLRRAMSRPVFRALASFGVGTETTNAADGLMVYGADDPKLMDAFNRLLGSDVVYGATQGYLASSQRYLEGDEAARIENGAQEFLDRLQAQRRRLFFTIPDTEKEYDHWLMTAFRFAGDYLEMIHFLAEGKGVSESTRARLVRGLNRVMTGLLIENNDKLFVASSGGFTQSRISVLCDTEAAARRSGGVGMRIKLDTLTERAALDVALAAGANHSASFTLSPVRFEFLCRVAEGALPGSFSTECLEDMLAFKAKLLRKAELLRADRLAEDEEPGVDDGALTLNFIEMEQSGHGFSRPVTVRVGA
jgi:broad-specificity NMP kinase